MNLCPDCGWKYDPVEHGRDLMPTHTVRNHPNTVLCSGIGSIPIKRSELEDKFHAELIRTAAWLEEFVAMIPMLRTPAMRQNASAKVLSRAKLIRLLASVAQPSPAPRPSPVAAAGGAT